jgi:hypothetical protein
VLPSFVRHRRALLRTALLTACIDLQTVCRGVHAAGAA